MRVFRGRGEDPESDAALTRRLRERAAATGEVHLRVWRPHRQCSFGRRDANAEGYEAVREAARDRGFPPTERDTGGRPVAYTGSTVAIALATPSEDLRVGIDERYEALLEPTQRALWRLGVPAQRGEPPNSFCPGAHSLQWEGKIAGFAQRVEKGVALSAGVVLVRDHEPIGEVLAPVYDALGLDFDPDSVGSLARAGGRSNPEEAVRVLAATIMGDADATVEDVEEIGPPRAGVDRKG